MPRAEPASVGAAELANEEGGRFGRGGDPVGAAEQPAGLAQRRHPERVPFRQHLVVEPGTGTRGAAGEQTLAGGLDRRRSDEVPPGVETVRDRAALEVAVGRDAVEVEGGVGVDTEHGAHLVDGPGVEQPLVAVPVGARRVRVLGAGDAAARLPQVTQHVLDGLGDDLAPAWLLQRRRRVGVHPHEQRLVVEHLLEVRHEPLPVDGVAGEPAADVVVHPAGRHRVEGDGDHLARRLVPRAEVPEQEQVEAHRRRELRGRAEAAPFAVERAAERTHGPLDLLVADEREPQAAAGRCGRSHRAMQRRSSPGPRDGSARRRRSPPSAAGTGASGSRSRRRRVRHPA